VSLAGLRSDGAGSGPAAAGFTVIVAVRCTALFVAVMVTAVLVVTVLLVTVKPALVAPALTVTLAGTAATATLELLKLTTAALFAKIREAERRMEAGERELAFYLLDLKRRALYRGNDGPYKDEGRHIPPPLGWRDTPVHGGPFLFFVTSPQDSCNR